MRGATTSTVTLLERAIYDVKEAARLLPVPASTLEYWLEGGRQGGKIRPPVLRETASGAKDLTWGEFVEARYVRAYRRDHGVPLHALRGFILEMRRQLGVPYPLAHFHPWVGEGQRLLLAAQTAADLPAELWSVFEPTHGAVLLTAPAESFLSVVAFDGDIARRIEPQGRLSPVVLDPEVRFGASSVKGVSTSALSDLVAAGDAVELVAEDYDLDVADVVAALEYERQLVAAAEAA